MNRYAILALLSSAALSSCYYAPGQKVSANQSKNLDQTPTYGYTNHNTTSQPAKPKPKQSPTIEPQVTQSEPNLDTSIPSIDDVIPDPVNPNTTSLVEPPVVTTKPVEVSLPYAKPFPGHANRVYSPFNGKPVSVDGLAPGSKAICPYTGKQFRVP